MKTGLLSAVELAEPAKDSLLSRLYGEEARSQPDYKRDADNADDRQGNAVSAASSKASKKRPESLKDLVQVYFRLVLSVHSSSALE